MTVLFNPEMRAVRPTTTKDPFHRYYGYLQDHNGGDYNIHSEYSSIAFKELEQLPASLQPNAQVLINQSATQDGVMEFFQWSYGGFGDNPNPQPRDAPPALVENWKSIVQHDAPGHFDDQGIPEDARLKLVHLEPPSEAGGRIPANISLPPYNFARDVRIFAQDTFFMGDSFLINADINQQVEQIRTSFLDMFTNQPTTFLGRGNWAAPFIETLLWRIFIGTPNFGKNRHIEQITPDNPAYDPGSIAFRNAEGTLNWEATFDKFVAFLTTAPILIVEDEWERNLINDYARREIKNAGGKGVSRITRKFTHIEPTTNVEHSARHAHFNAIAVPAPPRRDISVRTWFAKVKVRIPTPRNPGLGEAWLEKEYAAQAPLQNLLEIYYALMLYNPPPGNPQRAMNYEQISDVLYAAFGTGLENRYFYEALDDAIVIDREGFMPPGDRPFLDSILPVNNPAAVFEYYNFSPFAKNVFDYQSYDAMTGDTEVPENIEATLEFSAIYPEYNYYAPAYEKAIAAENIPEAVLPNMYIYSLVSDRNQALGGRPPWNAQDGELQNNFDRLITLDEFNATSLPAIGSDSNEEFLLYLENYAKAVTPVPGSAQWDDAGVTIDFLSDLAREYYNLTTPASEMNLYDRLNARKVNFPMYIETGFPMGSTGVIGSLIDESLSSTAFVDSVIKSPATSSPFYMAAKGFVMTVSSPTPVQRLFDTYGFNEDDMLVNRPNYDLVYISKDFREFDFEEWVENAMTAIETRQVGEEGEEPLPGECPGVDDEMNAQAVRDLILQQSRLHMKPYSELVKQDTTYSHSETIIYKLTKKRITADGVVGPVIQQFYFPNSHRDHLVKFVDTQVKYGAKYRYELYGVTVVYGSRCEMRVLHTSLDTTLSDEISVTTAVHTVPNPKIVEHPIHVNEWTTVCVGGLAFPDISVNDRPPPPPEVLIAPFKQNYRQVLLALNPSNEVFIQDRSIEWVLINEESDWEQTFRESILFQKQFKNYGLSTPKLEFAGESGTEIQRMEIYRSSVVEENATNRRDFYRRTFSGKLHKTLDTSGDADVPDDERALSFDCIDTLEPNVKYYYTARSIDVHGKASNPTPVYQVELVYDRGTYYPYVDIYRPKYKSRKQPTRRMSRFLEIKAAPIQSAVKNTFDASSKLLSSEKGFIPRSGNAVENNTFLVRLTSRDTGRKIQFNLTFKKSETTDKT